MEEKKHQLRWTAYTPPPPALPPGISRQFVPTPSGDLELLVALPSPSPSSAASRQDDKPPILFVHGTNCSAMCFTNWMQYFSARGYPSYSLAERGHGQSWKPSFLGMMFTFKHALAQDIFAGIEYVNSLPSTSSSTSSSTAPTNSSPKLSPILAGHSLAGGLFQYLLSSPSFSLSRPLSGLVLLASAPGTGIGQVLRNWVSIDPGMTTRMPRDLFHPRSMFATPALVRTAFFSKDLSEKELLEFFGYMPEFESSGTGMGFFGQYAEPRKVLANVVGIGEGKGRRRKVLLMAGGKDVLVTPAMMKAHAEWFRKDLAELREELGEEVVMDVVVERSAHHLMRDVAWEESAGVLLRWLEGEVV